MCFVMLQRNSLVILGAFLAISECLVVLVHGIPLDREEFEDRSGKDAFKLFYFPWLRDGQSLRDPQLYSPDMVNRFQLLANRHKRNPTQKPADAGDITVNPDNKGDVGDSILPIHKDTSSALIAIDHDRAFIPRLVYTDSPEFDGIKLGDLKGLSFHHSQMSSKDALDLHNEAKTDVMDATDEIEHVPSTIFANNIMKIQNKDRLSGRWANVNKFHPGNENENSPTLLEFFHKLLSLDGIPNRINKRAPESSEGTGNKLEMGKDESTKKVIEGKAEKSKITNNGNSNNDNTLDQGFLPDNDYMDSALIKAFGGQDIEDAGDNGRNPLVRIMVEETFVDPKPAWKLLDDGEDYGESLFNPIVEKLFGKPNSYIKSSAKKYKINRITGTPKVAKDITSTLVTESIVEPTLTTKCDMHDEKCICPVVSGTKTHTVAGLHLESNDDNKMTTGDNEKGAAVGKTSLNCGANTDALDKKITVKNDSLNTEKIQISTELNTATKGDSKRINENVNSDNKEKKLKDKNAEVAKHETSKHGLKSVVDIKEKSEQRADGFFNILRTLFGRKR